MRNTERMRLGRKVTVDAWLVERDETSTDTYSSSYSMSRSKREIPH